MSNKASYRRVPQHEDTAGSPHPTTSANWLSLLSFWWMNGIFKIGSKRPLSQSDILPPHEDDTTQDLTERLQSEWNKHVQKRNKTKTKQPVLWKCVLKTISVREILFLTSFVLVESTCRVFQPLVLGLLLHLLSSTKRDHLLEYACCLLLALSGLSGACVHYTGYRLELLGMRLSSAIKGLVYLKVSNN